jgi:hypothetical protein
MEHHGLKQSRPDPCLFVGQRVRVVCYVDDILFYASHDEDIDAIISLLKKDGIMIQKERSAEGFLGVNVKSFSTPGVPIFSSLRLV